jgi:hypothetical protein
MIATKWPVVVTYLGMRQPKKSCEPVISGPLYLKIVSKLLRSFTLARCSLIKCARIQPPLHPVIIIGPFTKWGVDFVDSNPNSARGHQHIIMAIDYFNKWVEAMPTVKFNGKTAAFFLFNQIIVQFGIPSEIVIDHGSHFQNEMMVELASKLGFRYDHSSPYYPQENGQVEAINKSLKTILKKIGEIPIRTSCYILCFGYTKPQLRLPPVFPLFS